mmetsp:Transcript_10076/g.20804  ORF Transcript_10076/g.20804 Transcript_10076/m.20804 type:complete len:342 (-) Transcript_10076:46-1071(-)
MMLIDSAKIAKHSVHGPLGPTWQPVYDTTYAVLQQVLNLPHLSFFTLVALVVAHVRGDLQITPLMPLVAVFGMARVPFVGIGMSTCLHRYFAHGAFSTSRPVQFVMGFVAAMSLQGGCLWWATKHVRHHKHCDQPEDPHSPTQTSPLYAWLGWVYHETHHDWIYLKSRSYLLTPEMLLINLLFFVPNMMVTVALVPYLGKEWALFTCWVPGIFGALATTHFNVDYHPAPSTSVTNPPVCLGVNKAGGDKSIGPIPLEWLATWAPWLFEPLVGEAYHEDHHEYPRRAHRPGFDVPYSLLLKPLADMGVIWDLQQPLPTDAHALDCKKKYPIHGTKLSICQVK